MLLFSFNNSYVSIYSFFEKEGLLSRNLSREMARWEERDSGIDFFTKRKREKEKKTWSLI